MGCRCVPGHTGGGSGVPQTLHAGHSRHTLQLLRESSAARRGEPQHIAEHQAVKASIHVHHPDTHAQKETEINLEYLRRNERGQGEVWRVRKKRAVRTRKNMKRKLGGVMNKAHETDKSNSKKQCCATAPHRGVTQWSYQRWQWRWELWVRIQITVKNSQEKAFCVDKCG